MAKAKDNFLIPSLRPWNETALYGADGKCIVPSTLARECELSYAVEHDLSALTFVKRHIRNFGFRHQGNNAYGQLKWEMRFRHEFMHICLGLWLNMLERNPLFWPLGYDGNQQAEAMVISLEYGLGTIQKGDFRDITDVIDSKKHAQRVSKFMRAELGKNLVKQAHEYNTALEIVRRRNLSIGVADFMRVNKINKGIVSPKKDAKTRLGETPIKLSGGPIPQSFVIEPEICEQFFDAFAPVHKSIAMTVEKIKSEICQNGENLNSRTVDMIFRTLRVRDIQEIMVSGEPRIMRHGRLSLFQSIEEHLNKKKLAAGIKKHIQKIFGLDYDEVQKLVASKHPFVKPIESQQDLDARIHLIDNFYTETSKGLQKLIELHRDNHRHDNTIKISSTSRWRRVHILNAIGKYAENGIQGSIDYLNQAIETIEKNRDERTAAKRSKFKQKLRAA